MEEATKHWKEKGETAPSDLPGIIVTRGMSLAVSLLVVRVLSGDPTPLFRLSV